MIGNFPAKWDLEPDIIVIGSGSGGQSAAITALLDRKIYYILFPLLPGGLLVLCTLAGKPELRDVVLTSEGFGYIFRISMLLATAWVAGGIAFLISFALAAAVAGKLNAKSAAEPWTIGLWRRVVTSTFGENLIQAEKEWRQLYMALDNIFPDETEE